MLMTDIRKAEGLSQLKFAAKYGIPKRTIEDWDRGLKKPTSYFVESFAKVLAYEKFLLENGFDPKEIYITYISLIEGKT